MVQQQTRTKQSSTKNRKDVRHSCSVDLAAGKHGRMVDMCCETTNTAIFKNVLCKFMESSLKDLVQINLFQNQTTKRILSTPEEFSELLSLFKKPNCRIAVKQCFDRDSLMSDVQSAYLVESLIYTEKKEKPFIQIQNLTFQQFDFSGMEMVIRRETVFFLSKNDSFYYYFSKKCQKTVDQVPLTDKTLRMLIKDMMDSLKILHRKGYYHGDIKTKNIMTCGAGDNNHRTFNLIDWGRLHSIGQFDPKYGYGGSTQAGSPLGFYFLQKRFKNPLALKTTLWYTESRCYKELKQYPVFNTVLWPSIRDSFTRMVSAWESTSQPLDLLFNRYKYTLDLFNFGLTIIHLVLKNGLNLQSYQKYINMYCRYDHSSFCLSLV